MFLAQHEATIRRLGFPSFHSVADKTSIAGLFEADQIRSGLYLLRFSDGFYYLGLATDVVRRFSQHRRHYGARIVGIAFQPFDPSELDSRERDLIRLAERKGLPLEQTEWKSHIYGQSDLEAVLSTEDFHAWEVAPSPFWAVSNRPLGSIEPGRRSRDKQLASRLLAAPLAAEAMALLHDFLKHCVPGCWRGEGSFWSLACMPSTNRTSWPRLFCLSAHVMEVLVFGHHKTSPKRAWGFVVCARSPLDARFSSLKAAAHALGVHSINRSDYRSAGHDQCRVNFRSARDARRFFATHLGRQACATLLHRVMRKGTTKYAKTHCSSLADALAVGLEAA